VAKVGRKVQHDRLVAVGIYLDEALRLANMTRAKLARRAGMEGSVITRVCNGERTVGRNTILLWCTIVACPEWLETLLLNAAGYASCEQQALALRRAQGGLSEVSELERIPAIETSLILNSQSSRISPEESILG